VRQTQAALNSHGSCINPVMPQVPIRWTPANTPYDEVVHYSSLLTELAHLGAKSVQELDPMNDWVFLRVRSQKHEIMVCPEKDFMMIVVQDPNVEERKTEEKV